MKNTMKVLSFFGCLLFASLSMAELQFEGAKIFAPIKGSNATAGYVTIRNMSGKSVEISLDKVESFKNAETHETLEKDGRMTMQKVDSYKILANDTLVLKPGGKHIMLFDPAGEIKLNTNLKVYFVVNKKSQVVNFKVVSRTEDTSSTHGSH